MVICHRDEKRVIICDMHHTEIAKWLRSKCVDPGAPYENPTALSRAVFGDNGKNNVTNILTSGRGAPKTLVKLARFLGENPAQVLVWAGLLKQEEITAGVTPGEAHLLKIIRPYGEDGLEWLETVLQSRPGLRSAGK